MTHKYEIYLEWLHDRFKDILEDTKERERIETIRKWKEKSRRCIERVISRLRMDKHEHNLIALGVMMALAAVTGEERVLDDLLKKLDEF